MLGHRGRDEMPLVFVTSERAESDVVWPELSGWRPIARRQMAPVSHRDELNICKRVHQDRGLRTDSQVSDNVIGLARRLTDERVVIAVPRRRLPAHVAQVEFLVGLGRLDFEFVRTTRVDLPVDMAVGTDSTEDLQTKNPNFIWMIHIFMCFNGVSPCPRPPASSLCDCDGKDLLCVRPGRRSSSSCLCLHEGYLWGWLAGCSYIQHPGGVELQGGHLGIKSSGPLKIKFLVTIDPFVSYLESSKFPASNHKGLWLCDQRELLRYSNKADSSRRRLQCLNLQADNGSSQDNHG